MKKLMIMGIILLLVCVSIPSSGRVLDKSNPLSVEGNILYVGGSGEGNYTKIQDAIDDAVDGDTVYVYSNIYYEYEIEVDKSINLIGEDKNTTTIDGRKPFKTVVRLLGGDTILCNFTIKNSDEGNYGIIIDSDENHISHCNIVNNRLGGIQFWDSGVENTRISNCYFNNPEASGIIIYVGDYGLVRNTVISHCIFDEDTIHLSGAPNTIISNCKFYGRNAYIIIEFMSVDCLISNCTFDSVTPLAIYNECNRLEINNCTITNCEEGIRIAYGPKKTVIKNCTITNSYEYYGILFYGDSKKTIISGCNISNNEIGLGFFGGVLNTKVRNCNFAYNNRGIDFYFTNYFNRFYQNNFIDNNKHIKTNPEGGSVYFMVNFFKENYWSDWEGSGAYHVCRLFNWDWNPAQEPYDI